MSSDFPRYKQKILGYIASHTNGRSKSLDKKAIFVYDNGLKRTR